LWFKTMGETRFNEGEQFLHARGIVVQWFQFCVGVGELGHVHDNGSKGFLQALDQQLFRQLKAQFTFFGQGLAGEQFGEGRKDGPFIDVGF